MTSLLGSPVCQVLDHTHFFGFLTLHLLPAVSAHLPPVHSLQAYVDSGKSVAQLSEMERFVYALACIPGAKERLNCMLLTHSAAEKAASAKTVFKVGTEDGESQW